MILVARGTPIAEKHNMSRYSCFKELLVQTGARPLYVALLQ